jgi:hypothetical protein
VAFERVAEAAGVGRVGHVPQDRRAVVAAGGQRAPLPLAQKTGEGGRRGLFAAAVTAFAPCLAEVDPAVDWAGAGAVPTPGTPKLVLAQIS